MRSIFRLLLLAKASWAYLAISIFTLIVSTLLQLYSPWVIQEMVGLISSMDPELLNKTAKLGCILAAAYICQAICQFVTNYYSHLAGFNFVSYIRTKAYENLQKLSLGYHHEKKTGDLISRLSYDTSAFEVLIAHVIPDIIVNLIILIGATLILFSLNVTLATICLALTPFIFFIGVFYARKIRPLYDRAQQKFSMLNSILQNNLIGIKEIQAFNQQQREQVKVEHISQTHVNDLISTIKISSIFSQSFQFLMCVGTAIIVGFSGYMIMKGNMEISTIIAFILYLGLFYQPISALSGINDDVQYVLACADRVFEIFDAEPDILENPSPKCINNPKGYIDFENVSFHYGNSSKVLKNINLKIRAGEIIALTGPSGVGKTTLINLLARFYDPCEGRITIDGHDLRDISLESLRESISMVLQDVYLFDGTVAENIAFGNRKASFEQIKKAAKIANAHEFIQELEKGYHTVIGERGLKLSGGQKQRISIARAILKDAPILIMDEATSSIDAESEKAILSAIKAIIKDRTTIIIAHRLSTIEMADRVLVIENGEINGSPTNKLPYPFQSISEA